MKDTFMLYNENSRLIKSSSKENSWMPKILQNIISFSKQFLKIKEKKLGRILQNYGRNGINLPFFVFFECTNQDKEYIKLFS